MRTLAWLAAVVTLVAAPGCRVGGSWNAETLDSPFGAQVELEAGGSTTTGELLLVRDDGIVVLRDRRAVLTPWEAITRLTFSDHPVAELEGGGVPSARQREEMALASRYPYGLTERQMRELLDGLGQDELEVVATRARTLPEALAVEIRRTTERFRDRAEAVQSGYRRLGPDFPGMGEHWVHPGLMMRGLVDPTRPPLLSYTLRKGDPVLVGIGFAVPLPPGEDPPDEPFGRDVWHDHSGTVDEEVLLLNHPSSVRSEEGGYRLSVVHVWSGLENPEGILVQNNWALPYWRVGLPVPEAVSTRAARGLSLAFGGRSYYRELVERAVRLSGDEKAAFERALAEAASRAERIVEAHRSEPDPAARLPEEEELEAVWDRFWNEVRLSVSEESWSALSDLSSTL